jgi:hypothetical protein
MSLTVQYRRVSRGASTSLMQVSKGLPSAQCELVSARTAPFAISSPSADHQTRHRKRIQVALEVLGGESVSNVARRYEVGPNGASATGQVRRVGRLGVKRIRPRDRTRGLRVPWCLDEQSPHSRVDVVSVAPFPLPGAWACRSETYRENPLLRNLSIRRTMSTSDRAA